MTPLDLRTAWHVAAVRANLAGGNGDGAHARAVAAREAARDAFRALPVDVQLEAYASFRAEHPHCLPRTCVLVHGGGG